MTNEELMCKLLQLVIEGQWSGRTNQSCHCHPEYVSSCPECGALKYTHSGSLRNLMSGKHKPDCERQELITKTREALDRYNNSIPEEERYDAEGEDRRIYFP